MDIKTYKIPNKDLVQSIMNYTGLPKETVKVVILAIISSMTKAIRSQDKVTIAGVGTLTPHRSPAHRSHNVVTRQCEVHPVTKFNFKPCMDIDEALNPDINNQSAETIHKAKMVYKVYETYVYKPRFRGKNGRFVAPPAPELVPNPTLNLDQTMETTKDGD